MSSFKDCTIDILEDIQTFFLKMSIKSVKNESLNFIFP